MLHQRMQASEFYVEKFPQFPWSPLRNTYKIEIHQGCVGEGSKHKNA